MLYNNFFLKTALVAFLAMPAYSFAVAPAAPVASSSISGDNSGFYAKLQYNGEFFNNIGDLKGDAPYSVALGYTKDSTVPYPHFEPYNPTYAPSYFGGSVALGYSLGAPRFEIEALYSSVSIDETGFITTEFAKDFILINPQTKEPILEGRLFKNEGFTNFAGMLNAYYDLALSNIPIAPYIGLGGGLTGIKFLDKVRYAFAYQAKAGVGYSITPQMKIFAGYRYFGVLGEKFSDVVPVDFAVLSKNSSKSHATDINNSFGLHGLEAGLIMNF